MISCVIVPLSMNVGKTWDLSACLSSLPELSYPLRKIQSCIRTPTQSLKNGAPAKNANDYIVCTFRENAVYFINFCGLRLLMELAIRGINA